MEKIWFFVEGDTEESFVYNLIRKRFNSFIIENDLSEFINDNNKFINICYCENCEGVDNIPYRINKLNHLVQRSKANKIIIICDIEKLQCPIKRRHEIDSKLDNDIKKELIYYVFFNPTIESFYFDCLIILKKVIKVSYNRKYKNKKLNDFIIPEVVNYKYETLLKLLCSNIKLKYRKKIFADEFFPRVDYNKCRNQVLARLINFINKSV